MTDVPDAEMEAAEAYIAAQQAKGLSLEQIEASLVKPARGKKRSAKPKPVSHGTTEVIPAPPKQEWSVADPSSMDRAVKAVIAHGDYEVARAATGCPQDVWDQILADPKFSDRYRAQVELSLLPSLPKALQEAMGTPYGTKIAFEVARGIKGDEADAQQARALKSGGLKARVTALQDIIKEAGRQLEVLTGGHAPLPAEIEEIIRTVTVQQEKIGAS